MRDTTVLGITEDHQALRDVVRRWVDDRVIPTVRDREARNEYPDDLIPELAALGVMGMSIPEEFGGSDVDYVSYGLVFEELARGWMGLASVVGSSSPAAWLIAQYGTTDQKSQLLPDLAQGRRVSAMALTEPSVGSDLKNLATTAVRRGDVYVVNGTKTMITHARHADPLVALVRTDASVTPPHRGMSLLLIDPDTPGYCVGRDMGKLGHKGLELCELSFQDAEVPVANLLGAEEGQGFYQMMSALDRGRIYMAGASIGIARAAYEDAVRYAGERQAFGQAIADFQAVKLKVADMAMQIEAARLLMINAAVATQANGRASTESAMAKVFASEVALKAAMDSMRIHGGYGYTTEFPVERYYRDAALMPIGEGVNDILLLLIADTVMGRKR
jgi:alkylation response protein AidB-like acyl-CoA dehydrogenase